MIKLPISLNDEDLAYLTELIDLLGLKNVFGDRPKSIKFSIRLAVSSIKNHEKVYTDLNPDELEMYFNSIVRHLRKQKLLQKALNIEKEAKKV